MKKTIIISTAIAVVIAMLAMPVFALTLSRDVPATATPGALFTVTYSTSGAPSGKWFVAWEDTITGGCLPASYRYFMAQESGGDSSQTKTFTAPSSGTCTFSGFYQEANGAQISFPSKTITITSGGTCTNGATQACTIGTCAGTQTCTNQAWSQCIKTDPNCGTTCTPNWQIGSWSACANNLQTRTVTDSNNCGVTTGRPATSQSCNSGGNQTGFNYCSIAEKANFFKITDNACTNGTIIIIAIVLFLILLLKK